MLRTKDAAEAMAFLAVAFRLSLQPYALMDGDTWEVSTKDADMGAALALLLREGDWDDIADIDWYSVEAERDRRAQEAAAAARWLSPCEYAYSQDAATATGMYDE